nr:hypothetical protein [Angustibacter aerolatus]
MTGGCWRCATPTSSRSPRTARRASLRAAAEPDPRHRRGAAGAGLVGAGARRAPVDAADLADSVPYGVRRWLRDDPYGAWR